MILRRQGIGKGQWRGAPQNISDTGSRDLLNLTAMTASKVYSILASVVWAKPNN